MATFPMTLRGDLRARPFGWSPGPGHERVKGSDLCVGSGLRAGSIEEAELMLELEEEKVAMRKAHAEAAAKEDARLELSAGQPEPEGPQPVEEAGGAPTMLGQGTVSPPGPTLHRQGGGGPTP